MSIRASRTPVPRQRRRALVLTAYLGYAATLLAWGLLRRSGRTVARTSKTARIPASAR
jgi:hypothetical protein